MSDERADRRRSAYPIGDPRSDARERALLVLYEARSKQIDVQQVLDEQVIEPDAITRSLVLGVEQHCAELDAAIARCAKGWTLERMPVIDLLVMRLGSFELLHRLDVPIAVVIDEAVELAKRFSTDDSGRFVNGVLAAIADASRPIQPDQNG